MAKDSKGKFKLIFIPLRAELNDIQTNTIPQVQRQFKYVENWGKLDSVVEDLPEDHKNVGDFFRGLKKMSPQSFRSKTFYDLWHNCNMEDITDYKLEAKGIDEEEDEF